MPRLSADRNIPRTISNIRLGSALQNCGTTSVADAFDKSSAVQLFVYDDPALGYSDWMDEEPEAVPKCFKADNPNGALITLLPLDGRILTGAHITKGGVCDCMLLTQHQMSLVEFKTNVSSTNNQTITQRAEEAIGQLWHTYNNIIRPKCIEKSITLEQLLAVDFYVVFDKDLDVTGAKSSLQDMQTEFLENNKYTLYLSNEKTFI